MPCDFSGWTILNPHRAEFLIDFRIGAILIRGGGLIELGASPWLSIG
jgi:hypothetical protein